jgi:hypothetical protein
MLGFGMSLKNITYPQKVAIPRDKTVDLAEMEPQLWLPRNLAKNPA